LAKGSIFKKLRGKRGLKRGPQIWWDDLAKGKRWERNSVENELSVNIPWEARQGKTDVSLKYVKKKNCQKKFWSEKNTERYG